MKKLMLVIIIIISLSLSACTSTIDGEKHLENEKWIEDINYIDKNLRDKHPDLFRYIPETEWEKQSTNLIENVQNLSDQDIALNIAKLISTIQDSHTWVGFLDVLTPIEPGAQHNGDVLVFPIWCEFFDDGLRVVGCDSEYEEILGHKLISINGVKIDEVIEKLSTLAFYDNEQSAKEGGNKYLPMYEFLEFLEIVDSDEVEYEFEEDEKLTKLNIKVRRNKDVDFIQVEPKIAKTYQTPERQSEIYWYKHFKEDEILYFKYNECRSDDGYYTNGDETYYPDRYFVFEEKLINEINNTEFNKFVIDLRNNPGGGLDYIESLVNQLKENTDLEDEDIVVITGKRTSSAASILAWMLQKELGATVIGEETGGNVNIFGTLMDGSASTILPNSSLTINHATMKVDNEEGYEGGVKPDVGVIQNYDDYLNGIDTCYEYIKTMDK